MHLALGGGGAAAKERKWELTWNLETVRNVSKGMAWEGTSRHYCHHRPAGGVLATEVRGMARRLTICQNNVILGYQLILTTLPPPFLEGKYPILTL